jgi:hypothetical protein
MENKVGRATVLKKGGRCYYLSSQYAKPLVVAGVHTISLLFRRCSYGEGHKKLYQLVAMLRKQHTRKYEKKNVLVLQKQPESLLQHHACGTWRGGGIR